MTAVEEEEEVDVEAGETAMMALVPLLLREQEDDSVAAVEVFIMLTVEAMLLTLFRVVIE